MNIKITLAAAILTLGSLVVAVSQSHAQELMIRPDRPNKDIGIRSTYLPYGNPGGGIHLGGRGGIERYQSLIVPGSRFGERIDYVRYGSPAYRAGLERGDIIVGFVRGNRTYHIRSPYSLDQAIQSSGRYLRLKVRNVRNGRHVYVTVDTYDWRRRDRGRSCWSRR